MAQVSQSLKSPLSITAKADDQISSPRHRLLRQVLHPHSETMLFTMRRQRFSTILRATDIPDILNDETRII
jgi:hypothetical protein